MFLFPLSFFKEREREREKGCIIINQNGQDGNRVDNFYFYFYFYFVLI